MKYRLVREIPEYDLRHMTRETLLNPVMEVRHSLAVEIFLALACAARNVWREMRA
jgi:hypothetical protein